MDKKPLFIAGPCVIESAELLDTVAATLADINRRLGVEIIFKASFDKANEGWAKLQQIVEDYKKAHNGASVYAPTFIEDCEPEVKKLQEEYGFEYTVEFVQ